MPRFPAPSWLATAGAAAFGALLALSGARLQPVGAQVGRPLGGDFPIVAESSAAPAPPVLEVQPLDATHFVVVTREPRLVRKSGVEGPLQNMLLTVVTHYTVQESRLTPIEHVRVPQGYRIYGQ